MRPCINPVGDVVSFFAAVVLLFIAAPHLNAADDVIAPPAPAEVDRTITITLGGDTGFSPNHAPVNAKGVRRHGQFQSWADTTALIAPHVDGDLNFINIETIVTDNNRLRRDRKGQRGPFNFRTHPNGARHLVERGFNVFSLANNHSMDYGLAGLKDTLRFVEPLKKNGLKAHAGLGMNREEASRPYIIPVKGRKIGYGAIGIVTNNLARHRAGENKPGQIAYRFDDDFRLVVDRLKKTDSDFKMLSIHYGLEGRVRTDAMQIRDWRKRAALKHGIDLIVGHHAHVPRGVEIAGKSVIFYGLGNFLHHGTANMTSKGICKDFGVFAKVHLARNSDGELRSQAIEVVPITNTHRKPKPMNAASARARIHALNYLGARLGAKDGSATGVRFSPQKNGRGLYCMPGAARHSGKIGALCRGWKPAPGIPAALRGRIAGSCAR